MKSFSTLALLAIAGASQAVVITQWNFNGDSSTTVPGGSSSPTPSIGAGTASLLGGVTGGFNSGTANGGSSDPVTTSPPNFGWQTTNYAAQGQENGQRGVQFAVSTVGYEDILIGFDTRHSNTSSRFVRLDYSADGGSNWTSGNTYEAVTGGDTWYNVRLADLSADTTADNNANFVVRMVTVFGPAGGYAASTSTATYAPTGTLRWDMVTVKGTAIVPEPASLLILGVGSIIAFGRRRRQK